MMSAAPVFNDRGGCVVLGHNTADILFSKTDKDFSLPRELILANPNMFVTFDACGWIRDLYWPHVGELNHILGYACRMGLSVDSLFFWLDESLNPQVGWESPGSSIARVTWDIEQFGVRVEMTAAIDPQKPLLTRSFEVFNDSDAGKTVALFLHHDFRIAESDIGDTALFHPGLRAMVHHKRQYWFAVGSFRLSPPIVQYACGIKCFGDSEGTWRDAEDSVLSLNPIAQGSVDSCIGLQAEADSGSSVSFGIWLACASGLSEMENLGRSVENSSPEDCIARSRASFESFLSGGRTSRCDQRFQEAFSRSVYVMTSHVSSSGAILAANDTDILQTARAHYSYVWPRDGAIISYALLEAGHPEFGLRFIDFCRPLISRERPYFLQKYCPTGAVGASWHPWIDQGREIVPFQEDGTALVLWLLGRYAEKELLPGKLSASGGIYKSFIKTMADFVAWYIDPKTGLPLPSYDPWEERRGIHAWTCGAVISGLRAAGEIALMAGASSDAARYFAVADGVRKALDEHFWDEEIGRYVRTVYIEGVSDLIRDLNPDSSVAGLFLFDAVPVDEPRMIRTLAGVIERLTVKAGIGGVSRNYGDYYFRVTDDLEAVPGNPWVICTLWAARFRARRRDFIEARRLIEWAVSHASPAGMLPEQFHPFTGAPLAVQPLAWSHAELALAMMESGLA